MNTEYKELDRQNSLAYGETAVMGFGANREPKENVFRFGAGLGKLVSYPYATNSALDNYYNSDAREAIKKLFNN